MQKKINNPSYIIATIIILVLAIGYYSYRSAMVKPDINKITTRRPVKNPYATFGPATDPIRK